MEKSSTKDFLTGMVGRMTANSALREDLMQEALVHLWRVETERPGQTKSWYWQSCRFHLQHYMAAGRSVDSTKRVAGQVPFFLNGDDDLDLMGHTEAEVSILAQVNAKEIVALLSKHLTPREREVLACLADGLGVRDIARKLKFSHAAAIKHRRKIAGLALKFGIASLPTYAKRGRNGRKLPPPAKKLNGFIHLLGVNGVHHPNGTVPREQSQATLSPVQGW